SQRVRVYVSVLTKHRRDNYRHICWLSTSFSLSLPPSFSLLPSSVSLPLTLSLNLAHTCITRSQTPLHTHTHTQSHTQHATLLITLMFTPHRMLCTAHFYSIVGGLSIRAIWATHCQTVEGEIFFCPILPQDRLICL